MSPSELIRAPYRVDKNPAVAPWATTDSRIAQGPTWTKRLCSGEAVFRSSSAIRVNTTDASPHGGNHPPEQPSAPVHAEPHQRERDRKHPHHRSEERRVGKECRSRWS